VSCNRLESTGDVTGDVGESSIKIIVHLLGGRTDLPDRQDHGNGQEKLESRIGEVKVTDVRGGFTWGETVGSDQVTRESVVGVR
jgi:hypothetical protein